MNVVQPQPVAAATADTVPRDYNFAADILTRNLDAGRAAKTAFIDPRKSLTYGKLARRADGFGRMLRARGIRREDRILLCMLDTVDWPVAFLGAIKFGAVPIPVNTLMTKDDYRFMLADSGAKMLVVSDVLLPKFTEIIGGCTDLEHVIVSGDNSQGYRRLRDLLKHEMQNVSSIQSGTRAPASAATAPHGGDQTRRHVLLALHLRFDRQAEGRRTHPCRPEIHRRALRQALSRHRRERRLLLGGEIVLRLWARQRADISDVGGRDHGAVAGPADAGIGRRYSQEASDHACSTPCRPSMRRFLPAPPPAARRRQAPPLRLGRRSAAVGRRPPLLRTLRRRHSRRARLDRDAAHFHLQPRRRGEIRHHRQAGARLRGSPGRRQRQSSQRAARWASCRCAARPAR